VNSLHFRVLRASQETSVAPTITHSHCLARHQSPLAPDNARPTFKPIVERVAKLICTTPEFDDLAVEVGLGNHNKHAFPHILAAFPFACG
jgi:hypothetical protein